MADKRISQLVDRGTVANNDVVPIVVSGATTTNKATISSIQTFMQGNLDLGVTSVGITLGSSGTDVSVSGSPITSSGNITINLPTASATNRGLLSSADWTTFNSKQDAGSFVTLDTTQTITAQKTFTTSGSSDTMIISHGSGSGFALDVLKAGNGEAIRVTKTSGSGNAMTISGGNFEAGTIVKTGGTSSQFLKADGTVDSSTYLTTGTATSTYVPYSGAAASVNLGVYSITANAINSAGSGSTAGQINLRSDAFFSLVNGYGSIASGTTNQFNFYQTTGAGVFRGAILSLNSITESATRTYTLPDASGTLAFTSQIPANPVGTNGGGSINSIAKFTGSTTTIGSSNIIDDGTSVNILSNTFITSGVHQIVFSPNLSGTSNRIESVGSNPFALVTSGTSITLAAGGTTPQFTLSSAGLVTLTGALNGTSATFSSSVTSNATTSVSFYSGTYVSNSLGDGSFATYSGRIRENLSYGLNIDLYDRSAATWRTPLSFNNTGGAATFSSSVTATGAKSQFIANGGTGAGAGISLKTELTTSPTLRRNWGLFTEDQVEGDFVIKCSTAAGGEAGVGNTRLAILSNGNVGIGTASPAHKLVVEGTVPRILAKDSAGAIAQMLGIGNAEVAFGSQTNHPVRILVNDLDVARFTTGGDVLIGATSFPAGERMMIQKTEAASLGLDRRGSDGGILRFYQDGIEEGNVTISGTTVSYNGGHLSRWSQTESNERIEGLVKGTVMSNLYQMAVWINPETGEPYENEQLNCIKISDIEGDKNVAGVFVNWDNDDQIYTNDINIAMTGDMIIRIAEGVVLEKGDLLISAGDGTAKPQIDDLIRSNTIAKVTSNHVTCVYEDGSYCVPCVLMAC